MEKKTRPLILGLGLSCVAIAALSSVGFADDFTRFVQFRNDSVGKFEVNVRSVNAPSPTKSPKRNRRQGANSPRSLSKDLVYKFSVAPSGQPDFHEVKKGKQFAKFEFSADTRASGQVPDQVKATQLPSPVSFTWFEDGGNAYLYFQDGTLVSPSVKDRSFSSMSAVHLELEGEKYRLESYRYSRTNRTPEDKTVLVRERDSKMAIVDSRFYPKLDELTNETVSCTQGVCKLGDLPFGVSLANLCQVTEVEYKQEQFEVQICDSESNQVLNPDARIESKLFDLDFSDSEINFSLPSPISQAKPILGLSLKRIRDGVVLAMKSEKEGSAFPRATVNDGILSLAGLWKKIDLGALDAEIMVVSKLGKAAVVRNSTGEEVDAPAEVMKSYVDIVADSLQTPGAYTELATESIICQISHPLIERRSVVLLGGSGTGKSSAVRAFAREAARGNIVGIPRTIQILEVDPANLASGTMYTGMIEQRVAELVAAAKERGFIYFIDEIHSLAGVGTSSEQSNDVTQGLKKALGKGETVVIATDTEEEFTNAFSADAAFVRRFDQVKLSAPIGLNLINTIKTMFQGPYDPVPSTPVLQRAIDLSNQFDGWSQQPAAATGLLSTARSMLRSERRLGERIDIPTLNRAANSHYQYDLSTLEWSTISTRLSELREKLMSEVIGQLAGIDAVVEMWMRKFTRVGASNRVNSILFVGPPGVGKTKLAEASADLMGYNKTVIEMNQYRSAHQVDLFLKAVFMGLRENQFRVFVLDEFEKAAMEVQEAALSMLQSGKFTVPVEQSRGRVVIRHVDAKNALFVLTSNAMSDEIQMRMESGGEISDRDLRELLRADASGISPRVISRVQTIVALTTPTQDEFRQAVALYLRKALKNESEKHGVQFVLDDADGFIEYAARSWTSKVDYRDAQRVTLQVERIMMKAMITSDFNPSNQGQVIHLKWERTAERRGQRYIPPGIM